MSRRCTAVSGWPASAAASRSSNAAAFGQSGTVSRVSSMAPAPCSGSAPTLDLCIWLEGQGQHAAGASAVDDRAVALAVGRVLRRGALGQCRQLTEGTGEFGQPRLDLGHPLGDQAGDVSARRLAAVADVKDLADVLEGEPGGLGVPDEAEALDDGRVVVAVAGRGAGRLRKQALVLPEPDRLGRYPGPPGRLADPHLHAPLTFQLHGNFTVGGGPAGGRPGRSGPSLDQRDARRIARKPTPSPWT